MAATYPADDVHQARIAEGVGGDGAQNLARFSNEGNILEDLLRLDGGKTLAGWCF